MAKRIHLQNEPLLDVKHGAFAYQQEAIDAVKNLEYAGVFHEQGLGKTKIAIDVFLHWLTEGEIDSVFVITKKLLIANWMKELRSHTHIRPRLLSQDRKANFFAFNSPARLFLASYEVVRSERKRLRLFLKVRDVGAILDESQKIKNPEAALTKTFHELAPHFRRRMIMTGTPVANRPYDLWAQVYFLDLGESLGRNFNDFRRRSNIDKAVGESEARKTAFEDTLEEAFSKLSAFTVRERKADGGIQLPRKDVRIIRTDWETAQYDMYREVRDALRVTILREGRLSHDVSENVLKRLLRLIQVASNPRVVDQNYNAIPGKFPTLELLLEDIHRKGEKAIIWTTFVANVEWLAKQLHFYRPAKLHGQMNMAARVRSLEQFCSDSKREILIATPAAGKEGLTLTVANHAVFFDRSFSLDDYLQAQDRIHRITQEKPCTVYNLVMPNSVDEWIDVLLHAKLAAAQLAQGDISRERYDETQRYDFGEILQEILLSTRDRSGERGRWRRQRRNPH